LLESLQFIKKFEPLWGNWNVQKFIGEGSHSKVFLITKEELGFKYHSALKVFHITQKDNAEEFKKEVLGEAQLLYSLRGNSHIVVYEDHQIIDLKDGISFLILLRMEYLSSLTQFLDDNKTITLREFLNMAMDICSALEFCHGNNIIHRDIKPDNIFFKDHIFKLGDFSVSKKIDELHLSYTSVGTPMFSAPEVILNKPYDIRTDIYSFGLVLYKILNANRLPFTQNPPIEVSQKDIRESIGKRLSGETLPFPYSCKDQHINLGETIIKACSFDPQNRFQNATELKNKLVGIFKSLSTEELSIDLFLGHETLERTLQQTELMTACLNENLKDTLHLKDQLLGTELMNENFFYQELNHVENINTVQCTPYGNLSNGNLMVNIKDLLIYSDVWRDFSLRIKTEEKEELLLYDYCWNLTLNETENTLFYTSGKDEDGIYSLNLQTNDYTTILKTSSTNLVIHGNQLYFINKEENRNIYKTNLLKPDPVLVLPETVKEFLIHNNILFYTNRDGLLFSLNLLDGGSAKCISQDQCRYLNLCDKLLYYVNEKDGNKITKITFDGKRKKILGDFSAEYLNAYKDRIYFSNIEDNFCLYSINTKGEDSIKLWDYPSEYIHIIKNRVYFLQTLEPKKLFWVDCYKR
jgi:serine/threonine protein kinase